MEATVFYDLISEVICPPHLLFITQTGPGAMGGGTPQGVNTRMEGR